MVWLERNVSYGVTVARGQTRSGHRTCGMFVCSTTALCSDVHRKRDRLDTLHTVFTVRQLDYCTNSIGIFSPTSAPSVSFDSCRVTVSVRHQRITRTRHTTH